MANLDVSDLILDPDFSDSVIVQRNRVSVTGQGVGVSEPTSVQIIATVVPAGSLDLNRLADMELLKGKIRVFTQFPLSAGDTTTTADIIFWQNREYTIISVDEYTNFGVGFVDAMADMLSDHNQAGQ